ncbi:4-hydroxybenzoate octaprenyltransferase [Candidatus Thiothrix sp. Deng01]|uniref:4-hydroxybenzoate octaprenyltransferase n=1 Tax=Candidatus Thiothrix phosphatis TaxID=3112415 RepID=A0ABU6D3Q2_9GAMM|nr:4-hydroxybenzoate octaprenyltransferase [Candidatus Thiothrix sp. Deng01]MEB4593462.1 4-hydroxybenzoate octaprenyltransferase [Candidatus Thiothrix sp. Deng01]
MGKLHHYIRLVRLDRPIGIYLLLWPALWALWIAAKGMPDFRILFVFVAGVVLMRSAGCAINDYADRHIDPHVARTKTRPLATGDISPREAVGVFAVLTLIAFLLELQLNTLTIILSLVAVLLAMTYPFMKRFHHLPQVHLGAAFSWAIPMAFTAVTGEMPPVSAWLLFVAAVLWTTAYDTMYAMCDRDDDLKIGVKSSAILFARHDRLIIGILQLLTLLLLGIVGVLNGLDNWYWLGLLVAASFALYQQWLIRDREPLPSLQAFLNNHWLGMSVFAGLALDYAF